MSKKPELMVLVDTCSNDCPAKNANVEQRNAAYEWIKSIVETGYPPPGSTEESTRFYAAVLTHELADFHKQLESIALGIAILKNYVKKPTQH